MAPLTNKLLKIVVAMAMAIPLVAFSFDTNSFSFAAGRSEESVQTNLVGFGPYRHLVGNDVIITNGLECIAEVSDQPWSYNFERRVFLPPVCHIFVISHITNNFVCLGMPASNLCKIALFDDLGHEVEKTDFGKMFGLPLSDSSVAEWRQQWMQSQPIGSAHKSIFITISSGLDYSQTPIQICDFSLKDTFKISKAGDYELHTQLTLVQSAKDPKGNFHFPVINLRETITKIRIDISEIQ